MRDGLKTTTRGEVSHYGDVEPEMGLLCVTDVTKIHGEPGSREALTALQGVSFKVENNLFCAILGQSGCGKTTLLNMVAGFERPTAGQITIDGREITRPGWRNTIIFQDFFLSAYSQNEVQGTTQRCATPNQARQ